MGFWKRTFQVISDVTSLGGTYRMRSETERYNQLSATYELLRKNVADANAQLIAAIEGIRLKVKRETRKLQLANSILSPLGNPKRHEFKTSDASMQRSLVQMTRTLPSTCQGEGLRAEVPVILGAGSGIGTGVASWNAVQVLGHASTGTAMLGLHGAAASNAGWAWFGGGSLATGGGGMAMGHFVLPGIGTALAVAVSATLSHREANRVGKLCDELEGVNQQNTSALSKLNSNLDATARLDTKLKDEGQLLDEALNQARRKVRRFGCFSHWWRLLRLQLKGYYYTREEFAFVEALDTAAVRFISAFKTI
jgi:hypothetical protein